MKSSRLMILILCLSFKFIISSTPTNFRSKTQSIDNDLQIVKSKPINCDRFDNEFFHYLLKRYNKDKKQSGRTRRLCDNLQHAANNCHQSNENLFKLIQQSNRNQFNEDDFNFSQSIIRLCPLVVFHFNKQQCIAEKFVGNLESLTKPNPKQVWLFAMLFVTLISCCSLVGVVVMPFANNDIGSYKDAFNLFEGLAVGSLVASSLFHLLPQAFNLTNDKNDDYLSKAMLIFGGIYLFFWSEILMKLMVELRKRSQKKKTICKLNLERTENEKRTNRLLPNGDQNDEINKDVNNEINKAEQVNEKTNGIHKDRKEGKESEKEEETQQIATVAWMIIFGDGLHNFIDGLSIGAAFNERILSGVSVSIAVICEELPHELGDFAVLIASGMTMKQAISYNFLSACTCYIGVIVGILIGDLTKTSGYILALAGGMFLYVSLVNIMSELTNAIDEAFQKSKTKMFKVILYQNIGILTGITLLYLLARYSEHLQNFRLETLTNHLIS